MNRYAACIEFCGVSYNGWQRQPHAPSVQARVEEAISKVADQVVGVVTCGRTDTGVHATGLVIHFDTACQRSEVEWSRGVNTYLPEDISLMWTRPVGPDFHARYAALSRSYRYVILNRQVSPSILSGRVAWHRTPLDVNAMREAAEQLLGEHDFSAFRSIACQNKNPQKHVSEISLGVSGHWIWLDITANGFLHHMVRNIIGVLTRIGEGLESPGWAAEILGSRDRSHRGITAPPEGLYFVNARYDSAYDLPPSPQICQFW
jgi:tRNA pseudouridine38-40 synthase